MAFKWVVGLVCAVISCPWRAPVDPGYQATRYGPQNWAEAELAREALQGAGDDMRFHEDIEPSHAGINGSQYRWPKNTLIYDFDPVVAKDKDLIKLIDDAMNQYIKLTCIRFKRRTTENDYVKIIKDPRQCYSFVGLQPSHRQPQTMSLDEGCKYIGTIIHEFAHALGCHHVHQRSDRDTYITVFDNNVDPAAKRNFVKTKPIDELMFGQKYDYESIMHYGECAMAKNTTACRADKNLRTMVAKDGKTKLLEPYDRAGLNTNDVELIKKLYKCP